LFVELKEDSLILGVGLFYVLLPSLDGSDFELVSSLQGPVGSSYTSVGFLRQALPCQMVALSSHHLRKAPTLFTCGLWKGACGGETNGPQEVVSVDCSVGARHGMEE
jgi:hypothetical protein